MGRTIERAVFVGVAAGVAIALAEPFVQVYDVVPYGGIMLYPYVPAVYPAPFYAPYFSPFAVPIAVTPACLFCPSPLVAFAEMPVAYTDPVDLIGDVQISSAFDESMVSYDAVNVPQDVPPPPPEAYLPASEAAPASQAEVQALTAEVESLNQTVAAVASNNEELREAVSAQARVDEQKQAEQARRKIQVSEEIRQQVRKQVKEELARHQEGNSTTVADVLSSPEAANYIFQVSNPINAMALEAGVECTLTVGDMARLAQPPAEGDVSAQVRVVTSKPGNCDEGATIAVSLSDLQDMINGFNSRLDQNMKKLHDQFAAAQGQGRGGN